MAQANLIPDEIPEEIWIEKNYSDIILYALSVFGPLEREVFININTEKKKVFNRMNKNTFHKWAKELKASNCLEVNKDNRTSIYRITQKGLDELLRRLEEYDLDFEILNKIEQERIQNYIESIKSFFIKYEIYNNDIKAEFLELVNEFTYDRLNQTYSEEKFNKLLLFLVLNHPKFYPIYNISTDDFILQYNKVSDTINENLTEADISTFFQKVFKEKIYGDRLYKLNLDVNSYLYFRTNGEYSKNFEAIVKSKFKYLYNMKNLGIIELTDDWLDDIYDEILDLLIEQFNLFTKDLRDPLRKLLDDYKEKLKEDFKKPLLKKREQLAFLSLPEKKKIRHKAVDIEEKEMDNLDLQLKNFEELIVQSPTDYENYFKKAKICEKIYNNEDALKAIEKAITLKSKEEPEYYRLKAKILLHLHDSGSNKSIPILEDALESIDKAIKLIENNEIIGKYLQLKTHILFAKGELTMAYEANEKAFELYEQIPYEDKDRDQKFRYFYHKWKAELLSDLGQENEAKKALENAVELQILNLYDKFEFLIYYLKDYDKANEIFEEFLKNDIENSEDFIGSAIFAYYGSEYPEILEFIDNTIALRPDLKSDLLFIKTMVLIDQYEHKEALEIIDNMIREYPLNKWFYYDNLIDIFIHLKRYKDALYILEKQIYKFPDEDRLRNDKTFCLVKLGKIKQAEMELEILLKKDPENRVNIRLNGIFRVALKEYALALEQFKKCLKLEKDHFFRTKIYIDLGKTYKKMGEFSKALENYDKATEEISKEQEINTYDKNFWKSKIEKKVKQIKEIM